MSNVPKWKRILAFAPSVAFFVMGAGLEVGGFHNRQLGWSLVAIGGLLLALPAMPTLRRVRIRLFLATPRSGTATPGPQTTQSRPTTKGLPGPGMQPRDKQTDAA